MDKIIKKHVHGFPVILVSLITLFFSNVCYAAPYAVDTGLPWDTLLQTLTNEFTGPIPKIMAISAVVMAGMMLMFGETSGMFKTAMQIVLGVGLAINIGDWVSYIMAVPPNTVDTGAVPAVKAMTDENFLSSFIVNIEGICKRGATALQVPVLKTLGVLTAIEIALALAFNFEQDHIKFVLKETIKVGFFVFLIQQWVGGTFGIANHIFTSFESLGLIAAGGFVVSPDDVVSNAFKMVAGMWEVTMALTWGSLGLMISNIIIMAGIIISVFFMVIEIVMCRLEFWIISVLTIPLIPFGINKHFKWLFEKATGAIFSLGIKLMVLSFVAAIAFPILKTMGEGMKTAATTKDITAFSAMLQILLGCLVLCVLVKKAPELAQGLLSGSPSLGGGDATKAVGGAAGMAIKGTKLAMGAPGVMALAKTMEGGRDNHGSVRMGGTVKNLGAIAMNKAKSPFYNGMSHQMHNMSQENRNNQAINDSKHGKWDETGVSYPGHGTALKRQLNQDTNNAD